MAIYSHSKLSTFEQCKLRYKFRHIDKIKVIETTIEAFLGKTVHSTLEWLYLQVKEKKIPTIEETINYYSNNWTENYKDSIKIIRQNLTTKDYFNKGVQFLIDYYFKHKPFEDNTLEVEKRIVLELDKQGKYKIQGYIDRLVHNLENNELEIHDYKTANSIPTKDKIEDDRQLALYSIAIKELFGQDKEVLLIWHYLAHNQKITSRRTNEQLEELKQDIINLINEIESTTEFPSNKSILCDWCEYKSICPEFVKQKTLCKIQNSEDKINISESKENNKELDIWD
jgi:putative RecB family exonuclease